jgi:hypothetical protein
LIFFKAKDSVTLQETGLGKEVRVADCAISVSTLGSGSISERGL